MLPRSERLTTTQFDRAFRDPEVQIVRHPLVHLKFAPRGDGDAAIRAAFVVPKKQGKASTYRNRVRRRLRERYRLHPLWRAPALSGYDLIFLSTPETANATVAQLDEGLENVLVRAAKRVGKGGTGVQSGRESEEVSAPSRAKPPVEAVINALEAGEPNRDENVAETVTAVVTERVRRPVGWREQPFTFLALRLIRFYQRFISPGLPPSCRFHPTCSRYTYEAVERFGVWQGGYLGVRRVCRCNPWYPGGFDPVPEEFSLGLRFGAGFGKFWARWRRPRKGQATL
jgi:hypothetical protein